MFVVFPSSSSTQFQAQSHQTSLCSHLPNWWACTLCRRFCWCAWMCPSSIGPSSQKCSAICSSNSIIDGSMSSFSSQPLLALSSSMFHDSRCKKNCDLLFHFLLLIIILVSGEHFLYIHTQSVIVRYNLYLISAKYLSLTFNGRVI